MDQVEERKRRLGRGRDDDEVERRVVSVGDEGGRVVVGFGLLGGCEERREGQEVAAAAGPGGDEGEYLGD